MKQFMYVSLYRPPGSDEMLFDYYEQFLSCIDAFNYDMIIMGDLTCDIWKKTVTSQARKLNQIHIYIVYIKLKASFNDVKSEMHGSTCYHCVWYGVILKPLKNCASKWSWSASKK